MLKNLQKNVLLKNYTSFKIGGQAKYFLKINTNEKLIEAIKWAKKHKLPFFILGGGSNLLVADEGYEGLVINFQFSIFKKIKLLLEQG
ncbi:FAD-binding protein [Patescibacteria group bacterium]|nr:FAD-binding protein [Patescibacteria group bacterium]